MCPIIVSQCNYGCAILCQKINRPNCVCDNKFVNCMEKYENAIK